MPGPTLTPERAKKIALDLTLAFWEEGSHNEFALTAKFIALPYRCDLEELSRISGVPLIEMVAFCNQIQTTDLPAFVGHAVRRRIGERV